MWSNPFFWEFSLPGQIPLLPVFQGLPEFLPNRSWIHRPASQSRRATSCATPGYGFFNCGRPCGQGRFLTGCRRMGKQHSPVVRAVPPPRSRASRHPAAARKCLLKLRLCASRLDFSQLSPRQLQKTLQPSRRFSAAAALRSCICRASAFQTGRGFPFRPPACFILPNYSPKSRAFSPSARHSFVPARATAKTNQNMHMTRG